MLSLIIGLLTFVLVFICAMLIVLILAQLPKKDAGAGLAFGAGTAEAIFGAGAGTPLAQITKYCAGIFLGLALTLSALNAYRSNQGERLIEEEAARQAADAPAAATTDNTLTNATATVTSGDTTVTAEAETTVVPVPETGSDETEAQDSTKGETSETTTPEITESTLGDSEATPLVPEQDVLTTEPNPDN